MERYDVFRDQFFTAEFLKNCIEIEKSSMFFSNGFFRLFFWVF